VKLCNFWSHHTGIAALFTFNVLPQVVNVKQCIVNEAAVTVKPKVKYSPGYFLLIRLFPFIVSNRTHNE